MNRGHISRRFLALFALLATVSSGLVFASTAAPAQATSSDSFHAGDIISDQNFFDPNAMSVAQIQAFLSSKITRCTTGNCLNVLTVTTATRAAYYSPQGYLVCNPYIGAANETAATVIYKVQQACSVSAKVILVTLQKEEGLVTKNSVSAATLARAMGYGCPDSANGACDSLYYGFYNQVWNGAKELRRYGTVSPVGNYQPGVKYIQYSPSVPCGGSNVNITNRATAALYDYTPYQPNQAALNNLNGTGDACSSYGNRNFWVYYNAWFGDPTVPAGTPEANLDVIPSQVGQISVSGWAVDPDAPTATVPVSVQIDQSWYALYATGTGADLSAQYAGAGTDHYFSGHYPIAPGNHTLCIYLVNAGGAGGQGTLGCQTVAVPYTPTPLGGIKSATATTSGLISFSGWSVRPDALTAPVNLATQYGNTWTAYTTNLPSTAAVTAVPGAGPHAGFAGSFVAPPGPQTFCLWAAPTQGPAVQIGCTTVVVPQPAPAVTKIDSITGGSGAVTVSGWAVYPDTPTASINMAIQIGANWYSMTANQPSKEPQATVPTAGPNQGFLGTVPLAPGTYSVCVWVSEAAGSATDMGCRTVTVAAAPPTKSHIDSIAPSAGGISVAGWAIWPDQLTTSVYMAVQIDSSWYAMTADGVSAEGAAAVSGAGSNHGFASTIAVAHGTHQVCIWAGASVGGAADIGCQTVTVAAAPPTQSHIDSITGAVGAVHVSGWSVWPDQPAASVFMAIQIGNSWTAMTANSSNAESATTVPTAGTNHGFVGSVTLPPGTYPVCVWAGNSAGGAASIGCQTVTVLAVPPVQSHIDSITTGTGTISVAGWAVWPDKLTTSVNMAIQIDASWYDMTANSSNAAAATAVPGAGTGHGFSQSQAFTKGTHQVCIWAGLSGGGAVDLGCQIVTVH
jgi:hypothetical protein